MKKYVALIVLLITGLVGILLLDYPWGDRSSSLPQSGSVVPSSGGSPTTTTLWGTPIDSSYPKDLAPVPNGWKVYKYVDFSIAFPEPPTVVDQSKELEITAYRAGQEDGTQYFLSVTGISKNLDINDIRKLLENAVLSTVQNVNGKLDVAIDTRNATGYDSIDFVISIPDGPRTYTGRNILYDHILYEMRAVYVDSSSDNAERMGSATINA